MSAGARRRILSLDDRGLAASCEIDLYRASGAGGQKRNKTSSAVRMRHRETGIMAQASDSRSQADNRHRALARLRACIALDLREPVDSEFICPSEITKVIAQGPLGKNSKTRVGTEYLLLVAEILDVFASRGAALSIAATALGVSTASLGKLLVGDERLSRRVAEMRSQKGLKPLH